MKKIGLLSDTHGFLDERVFEYFQKCDEIWHAGDIGDHTVTDALANFKPLRAVYGNIDGRELRSQFDEKVIFEIEKVKVFMIHIGGKPPRYAQEVRQALQNEKPDLFICGHSHLLKVMKDPSLDLLYMNPGAAGHHGFHHMRTLLRFDIEQGKISSLEVIELGKRGR